MVAKSIPAVRPRTVAQPTVASEPVDERSPEVAVWDRAVRGFHWLLVAAIGIALATGWFASRWWQDVHVGAGVVAAALVTFRLVWGMFGPTYARFDSFLPDPRRALSYLRDMRTGRAGRFIGHNPLGAMMIFALLVVIAALTVTGVVMLGGLSKEGPAAAFTSFQTGAVARDIHEWLAYGVVGLVVLHVTGALHDGPVLLRSMITGRKPGGPDAVAAPARPARPHAAFRLCVVIGGVAVASVVVLSGRAVPGVPVGGLDPLYAKECGACHSAHHPSLAPARTWSAMVAGLGTHFGEDASLSEVDTKRIAEWLAANSAEKFDTVAANVMRTPDAKEPLRITATKGWQDLHRNVSEAEFKLRTVGGRLNCTACHADAETGRFAVREISIPKNPKETRGP